jgi:cation diffusion facilitator family transporter
MGAKGMDSACNAFPDQEKQSDSEENFVSKVSNKTNLLVMSAACIIGILLMSIKFFAYWLTGSSAILSDALESIINVVASFFGLISVIIASKPADESHPYGHGNIEFFSAGFEGALILLAAGGIVFEGVKQILDPVALPHLGVGLLFLALAGVGNLTLGMFLIRMGKRTKSLVLEADGRHLLTDVITSGTVLLGVGAVHLTGWLRLDGVIACIAGINIVLWGFKLVRQAFMGLMQTSNQELLDEICDLLIKHKKDNWIDVHRLRAWRTGRMAHVDFHLIMPRDIPLEESHREVKVLERIFSDHFECQAEILIHLDPCEDSECTVCEIDPCGLRKYSHTKDSEWNRRFLIADNSLIE